MTDVPNLIRDQLAPTGTLRAAINMSNFLLVVDRAGNGDPVGPSPDVATAVAEALNVPVQFVPYRTPSDIAAAAGSGEWDIANIGAEPQRAAVMDFTAAYAEIEATYLVPAGSGIQAIDDVDQPGNTISVASGSAYGLWLENNVRRATLRATSGNAFDQFVADDLDALAALRSQLVKEQPRLPGSRLLDGQFTAVQQAVGINLGQPEALDWLGAFVEDLKTSGFVADAIERHGVEGQLSVAPRAEQA